MTHTLRFLQRRETQLLRKLRMAALVESPQSFGETAEEAARRSEAEWDVLAERLAAQATTAMVVAQRGSEAVGMAFVFYDEAHEDGARIGGMWVAPSERRRGLGDDLIRVACEWARARGRRSVRLWVGSDMAVAMAFYRLTGFVATGASRPFPGQEPRVIVELRCDIGVDPPGTRVVLHQNEARKRAFGMDAEAYDKYRPRYPAALVDRVVAHANVGSTSRALEIGSGTSIATLPFAELGCAIHCLELHEEMAIVARRNLAPFRRVTVETVAFEDWVGQDDTFDLVFCAQAWHWLPRELRYSRTSALLRAGGTLAVFANWDAAVLEEVQAAYRRHGPPEPAESVVEAWRERYPPDIDASIEDARASIERSGFYRDIELHRIPWTRSFDAHEYVGLLRTHSDHGTLPTEVREPLLRNIAKAIDEAGGTVTRHYEAVLLLARPAK